MGAIRSVGGVMDAIRTQNVEGLQETVQDLARRQLFAGSPSAAEVNGALFLLRQLGQGSYQGVAVPDALRSRLVLMLSAANAKAIQGHFENVTEQNAYDLGSAAQELATCLRDGAIELPRGETNESFMRPILDNLTNSGSYWASLGADNAADVLRGMPTC